MSSQKINVFLDQEYKGMKKLDQPIKIGDTITLENVTGIVNKKDQMYLWLDSKE